jgi:hypothetical protein
MLVSLAIILLVLACCLLAWWWLDVRTPRSVAWRSDTSIGVSARRADGLVLQFDDGATAWASRGYSIYRSVDGAPFTRVARIRPPRGEALGGYSAWLRRRFGYQELVEVLPLASEPGVVVVVAAGIVHRVDLARSARVQRCHTLRYFGRGRGRGLMAFGICEALDGTLYIAEYVTESGDRPVGVQRSADGGRTWTVCYEFAPGTTRHVHVVAQDHVDDSIWIGTGDRDEHCFVGRSTDQASTFGWVASGAQIHRTCAIVHFAGSVVWPMDADFEPNHLVHMDRATGEVTARGALPDATYYAHALDAQRLLIGVAQGVAEVWVGTSDGATQRWLGWPVAPEPPARGPSPGVRLARRPPGGPPATLAPRVLVNPLRTTQHEAAIFECATSDLPEHA